MPPPDIADPLDFHESHESSENKEALRHLLSLVLFTRDLESFGHAINALRKVESMPEKTLHISLVCHAGNVPMSISPELKALEILTCFNICSKSVISQDECIYTLTDPVGTNFSICLTNILREIGDEYGGPTLLREIAIRKGVKPASHLLHLVRTKTLDHTTYDEWYLKRDLEHLRYHFQIILDSIRADLAFYLIDDADPKNRN